MALAGDSPTYNNTITVGLSEWMYLYYPKQQADFISGLQYRGKIAFHTLILQFFFDNVNSFTIELLKGLLYVSTRLGLKKKNFFLHTKGKSREEAQLRISSDTKSSNSGQKSKDDPFLLVLRERITDPVKLILTQQSKQREKEKKAFQRGYNCNVIGNKHHCIFWEHTKTCPWL